jgi:hypothetical protein
VCDWEGSKEVNLRRNKAVSKLREKKSRQRAVRPKAEKSKHSPRTRKEMMGWTIIHDFIIMDCDEEITNQLILTLIGSKFQELTSLSCRSLKE